MIDIKNSLQYRIDWEQNYYNKTMARISTLKEMGALLPDLPDPYSTDISVSFSSIDLSYPASFELESSIVAMLEVAGFHVGERDVCSYGFSRNATHPDFKGVGLCIDFSSSYEESTCVLSQIGTREVIAKLPVYEVICSEGAKEPW